VKKTRKKKKKGTENWQQFRSEPGSGGTGGEKKTDMIPKHVGMRGGKDIRPCRLEEKKGGRIHGKMRNGVAKHPCWKARVSQGGMGKKPRESRKKIEVDDELYGSLHSPVSFRASRKTGRRLRIQRTCSRETLNRTGTGKNGTTEQRLKRGLPVCG